MLNQYVLQTNHLTRAYQIGKNEVTALCDVSLQILPGEFVAIMGPSGSGKSTLLNLLGGLDTPTEGDVLLNGQSFVGLTENQSAELRRHTLGFIFQGYDLFPVLTALENVMFPLLVAGVPLQERVERAQSLLAKVGLSDKAQHFPDELSGGQQQRVGIARALASHPLILLADEPTGNLDSASANEILDVLTKLVEEEGLTLVMVTHDPASARRAQHILHLKDGHLLGEEMHHD
jgi:putative ABC transport system ATP-binding protein